MPITHTSSALVSPSARHYSRVAGMIPELTGACALLPGIFPPALTTLCHPVMLQPTTQRNPEGAIDTMRLTRLRGTCPDTETCPTLYRTDRGTGVVQGYVVTDPEALATLDLSTGQTAVEVPLSLLTGLTIPTLYRTDRGTGVVHGYVVTDPEALATLDLPTGETAVEVPLSLEVPA